MLNIMAVRKGMEYLQQCRLCRDTNEEFTDIFGEDGLKRNLAEKIRNCLSLMEQDLDFDECMVEYYGRKSCKQFMHGNLICFEYNVRCSNTSSCCLINFDIYQVKNPHSNTEYEQRFENYAAPMVPMRDQHLVREDDFLPKLICTKCILMVEQLYCFRNMCTQSELTMESNLRRNLVEPEVCIKEAKVLPQLQKLKQEDRTAKVPLFEEDSSSGSDGLVIDTGGEEDDMGKIQNNPTTVPDKGDSSSSVQIGQPGPEDYVLMKEESFFLNREEDSHRATAIEFHRSSVPESDKDILRIQKKRREILPQMWDVYEKTVNSNNIIAVKHRRYIVSKSAFPCSLCGKCFDISQGISETNSTSMNTLDKCKGNSARASFPCHVCGKSFSFCNALKRHLQTHFNYKLYSCTLCGRGFSRKEHLTRHTLSHTGGRPYHCDICNKPFTRKEHLTRHRSCHSLTVKQENEAGPASVVDPLRPFSCEHCGHGFSRKDHLNQHQKRMHPRPYHDGDTNEEAKPYMCCICKKNFTRKEHLVRHQGIHVREFLLASTETSTGENVSFPLVPPH